MKLTRRSLVVLLALALVTIAATAFGLEPDRHGWYETGSATRTKTVFAVKVYKIHHHIKQLPAERSRAALIAADVDKKFTWDVKRDLPADKVQASLKESFEMNGYKDQAKIAEFLGAFKSELKEDSHVHIVYDASAKTTTVTTGSGRASVAGADFMKGVWSIWFGKIDPPSIGDQLMADWK
jgi:hypothetical protein